MTEFVESFTTQQLIPPWIATGSRIWNFIIKAHPLCMQEYLDTHLNSAGPDRSPYYYRATAGDCIGMLTVADHVDFSSGYSGKEGWDTLAHKEVFWSFPAERYEVNKDNLLGDHKIVWIQPFYFDDSSTVMFSSREIWGSEKQLGRITLNEGFEPDNLHIDLSTQGFREFSPRSKSRELAVMHIRMKENAAPVDKASLMLANRQIGSFSGALLSIVPFFEIQPDAQDADPTHFIEINTLKQFRDVFDMQSAAYRAIIASRISHTVTKMPQFYAGKDVELSFMWSDTMQEQFVKLFGLTDPRPKDEHGHTIPTPVPDDDLPADWSMARTKVVVEFAMSFTSNARFEVDRTLYTYGPKDAD
ncbi:hypothetical protein [Tsuneonella mangrovi]|uniref:hypothetical protein n=1 Tax=Tsuneonella mangrovi TaxID=1982042 RepID=UPI000BA23339|nr:hypothetical protein [Tsuneonella mangrovi]